MSDPIVTRAEDLAAAIGRTLDAGEGAALAARVAALARQQLAILSAIESLIAGDTAAASTVAAGASAWPKGTDGLVLLPRPQILETIDYETILARRKADLMAAIDRERTAAVAAGRETDVADLDQLGEYLVLESVPETILLEEAAWSEMLVRYRANEMYLSRLVLFSAGTDLDNNAEGHGVERLAGESDNDLKLRVRIKNRGSSSAGPDDWWRYHAMRAHEDVEDVAVTRSTFPFPAPGEQRGRLVISVLAETVDGTPSTEILDAVRAVVTSPAVRGACVAPIVQAATTSRSVDIAADIWLRPTAAAGTFGLLETRLRDAWAAARGLGWSVTDSWIKATLTVAGVQRVELPGWHDVTVLPGEAPRLGTVTLSLRGTAI